MAFSPEEISQILEEFFKVIGTRQYIGARYVPIFGRKDETSIEWDNSAPYEPLTIVTYQGNSYTSRQWVPTGVNITDTNYWACTGSYNSQIEQYRQDVLQLSENVTNMQGSISDMETNISEMQSTVEDMESDVSDVKSDINSIDTAISNISSSITSIESNVSSLQTDVTNIETDVSSIEDNVSSIQTNITAMTNDIETNTELINGATGKFSFKTGIIPGKYMYELFTFPKANYRIDLVPTVTTGMVAGNALTEGKSVFDYVLENNPYFACNINPGGNVIYNNILYGEDWSATATSRSGFYGTTADGDFKAARSGSFVQFASDNDCVAAIGSWQPLIINNVLEPIANYETFQTPNPYPVLGQDDNNIYILETFSRFNGFIGMTVSELQTFISSTLHWENAYLFDGGGSIQAACGNPAMRLTPSFANQNYADRIQHMVIVISER